MANYPTFKLEGAEKELLTTVFSTKMWDVSKMPSKLYLHTGHGILKAIRPKFFVMVKCNHEHVEGTHEIFGFEMAGEDGIQTVRVNTYNGPSILFASPEDFDYWRTTGRAAYQIPTCGARDILCANEYEWDRTGLKLWYNKLGTPSYRGGFGFRVWIDRDGMHADHEPFHQSYGNLYKTREECATNLPTVAVCDFDDDEPEEKKTELTPFEDRLAEIIYDAIGECNPKVMDECCYQARKYSSELLTLAKNEE